VCVGGYLESASHGLALLFLEPRELVNNTVVAAVQEEKVVISNDYKSKDTMDASIR
jgi:hypothetical protein